MRIHRALCFSLTLLAALAVGLVQAAQGTASVTTRLADRSEGMYAHEFTLVRPGAQPLRLNWVDRLSEIRATSLYDSKLLALGAIDGSAEGFSVVTARGGERPPEAFVLGREPLVSPGGRFVSFMQFVPRQAQVESQRDIVLIYDLQRPRNEVAGVADDEGWVSRASNQGVIVYPGVPRSERVFPAGTEVPGAGASEVKARGWSRDGEQHLIVAAEGSDLVVLAVGAGPDGVYKVKQARVSARQAFGATSPGSWSQARVLAVAFAGPNDVAVTFDASSGVPGGRLQLALR